MTNETGTEGREKGPAPIRAVDRYFPTRCELCGWFGSSGQCHIDCGPWGDSDVTCPSCLQVFLCDEVEQTWFPALSTDQTKGEKL